MEKKIYTAKSACKYLTAKTGMRYADFEIGKLVRLGHIEGQIIGRTYIIPESALDQYAATVKVVK